MEDTDRLLSIFARTDIEGLDFNTGVERFGGNPKLYVRIIKVFVDNIGPHLDSLAGLTESGLETYGIEVHGVKGSLYGINANKEGDIAMELELDAKAGEYGKVKAGNGPFIEAVYVLIEKLRALLAETEEGETGRQRKTEPDRALLGAMLKASHDFDVENMQGALKELENYDYENGGDLVKWLGEQVTAFGYDKIEERLAAIL